MESLSKTGYQSIRKGSDESYEISSRLVSRIRNG